ncbi:hypothetical protein BC830DRAFT_669134 [Chytriomyces sp. MP71]|nr:hypothetical protein BC830DRAFT_669134 [Chytriomyces sp. MP71]
MLHRVSGGDSRTRGLEDILLSGFMFMARAKKVITDDSDDDEAPVAAAGTASKSAAAAVAGDDDGATGRLGWTTTRERDADCRMDVDDERRDDGDEEDEEEDEEEEDAEHERRVRDTARYIDACLATPADAHAPQPAVAVAHLILLEGPAVAAELALPVHAGFSLLGRAADSFGGPHNIPLRYEGVSSVHALIQVVDVLSEDSEDRPTRLHFIEDLHSTNCTVFGDSFTLIPRKAYQISHGTVVSLGPVKCRYEFIPSPTSPSTPPQITPRPVPASLPRSQSITRKEMRHASTNTDSDTPWKPACHASTLTDPVVFAEAHSVLHQQKQMRQEPFSSLIPDRRSLQCEPGSVRLHSRSRSDLGIASRIAEDSSFAAQRQMMQLEGIATLAGTLSNGHVSISHATVNESHIEPTIAITNDLAPTIPASEFAPTVSVSEFFPSEDAPTMPVSDPAPTIHTLPAVDATMHVSELEPTIRVSEVEPTLHASDTGILTLAVPERQAILEKNFRVDVVAPTMYLTDLESTLQVNAMEKDGESAPAAPAAITPASRAQHRAFLPGSAPSSALAPTQIVHTPVLDPTQQFPDEAVAPPVVFGQDLVPPSESAPRVKPVWAEAETQFIGDCEMEEVQEEEEDGWGGTRSPQEDLLQLVDVVGTVDTVLPAPAIADDAESETTDDGRCATADNQEAARIAKVAIVDNPFDVSFEVDESFVEATAPEFGFGDEADAPLRSLSASPDIMRKQTRISGSAVDQNAVEHASMAAKAIAPDNEAPILPLEGGNVEITLTKSKGSQKSKAKVKVEVPKQLDEPVEEQVFSNTGRRVRKAAGAATSKMSAIRKSELVPLTHDPVVPVICDESAATKKGSPPLSMIPVASDGDISPILPSSTSNDNVQAAQPKAFATPSMPSSKSNPLGKLTNRNFENSVEASPEVESISNSKLNSGKVLGIPDSIIKLNSSIGTPLLKVSKTYKKRVTSVKKYESESPLFKVPGPQNDNSSLPTIDAASHSHQQEVTLMNSQSMDDKVKGGKILMDLQSTRRKDSDEGDLVVSSAKTASGEDSEVARKLSAVSKKKMAASKAHKSNGKGKSPILYEVAKDQYIPTDAASTSKSIESPVNLSNSLAVPSILSIQSNSEVTDNEMQMHVVTEDIGISASMTASQVGLTESTMGVKAKPLTSAKRQNSSGSGSEAISIEMVGKTATKRRKTGCSLSDLAMDVNDSSSEIPSALKSTSSSILEPDSSKRSRKKTFLPVIQHETGASRNSHVVSFTGLDDVGSFKSIVEWLAGTCTDSWKESTHLVTEKVKRTVKFLCCLNAGKFIDKAAEKMYGFSLEESIKRAQNKNDKPFLSGVTIYTTPHVQPGRDDMREIIMAAGGQVSLLFCNYNIS